VLGARANLPLPPGGKGQRTFQCLDCDDLDPPENRSGNGLVEGRTTAAEVGPPGTFVGFEHAELMFLKSTQRRKGNLLIPSPPLFGFYR
jgi:hypothetical protein